jgi:hypothetical protein
MKTSLVVLGLVSFCLAAAQIVASPLEFGSLDDEAKEKHEKAREVMESLGMGININDEDIVKIGGGVAIDEDEVIEGDVVVIGGGLTVEGTIKGDAVVIGGSMYLTSTAFVGKDAAVIGGILEMEDGATVRGDVIERAELMDIKELEDLEEIEEFEEYSETSDDIVKFAKDIHIERGDFVDGDVVSIGGDITVEGTVTGDVVATAGDVYIASTAVVEGDIVATFGDVTVEAGAVTEGEVIEVDMGGAHAVAPRVSRDVRGYTGDEITYLVTLHRPDADDVRLTGSWLDWDDDGIRMKRDKEGTWKTRITLGPGVYRYKFIVDGKWIPDPDIEEKVPDGMGGLATPLVVKARGKKVEMGAAPIEGHSIIFSLDRPGLYDVRVTGSWLDWDDEGIPMKHEKGNRWAVQIKLPAGMHAYKFYINDEWVPDPDVEEIIEDRMGGWATPVVVKPKSDRQAMIKFLHDRPDISDMRITGCWLDWNPEGLPMYKGEDGVWYTYVAFDPGVYEYKFYLDGKWMADPDTPEKRVPDGKGGYMTRFTVKAPKKKVSFAVRSEAPKERDFSPLFDYNRVDGVYLGTMLKNETNNFPFPQYYVEGGYSFKRERWMYTFELEQPILAPFSLSLGGSIYDKTDTYDKELLSDVENLIATSFLKRDYRDYFDRRGVTGFGALRPGRGHTFKVAYSADEYRPLETRAHTALFRKDDEFRANPSNLFQICVDPEINCIPCDCHKIEVTSLTASYEYDDRGVDECCPTPRSGLWVRMSGEWADRDWGGDLDYDRYVGDVRQHFMLSPRQQLSMRFMGGLLDIGEKPCPGIPDAQYFFPKQFTVGGIGTLPGYGYKQFQGTHMLLANVEYAYWLQKSFCLVFFSDAGDAKGIVARDAWDADDIWEDLRLKFDAGIGLRHEEPGEHTLTLGVAKGLTKLYDDDERPVIVTVRASRMF